MLILFLAGLTIKTIESAIEHTAKVVINEISSQNLAKGISVIPESCISLVSSTLFLNFISSIVITFHLENID